MKKNIKTILGYIAGGATVLNYQALYDIMARYAPAKKSGILMKEQLDSMEYNLSKIEKIENAAKITPEIKVQAGEASHYNKFELHDLLEIHRKFFNSSERELTSKEERFNLFRES